jgi:hypothetical protein
MANIVSSSFTASAQKDGRQQVHEVHTDLVGLTWTVDYLAGASDDLNANMAAHAVDLGSNLALAEVSTNVSATLTLGAAAQLAFTYSSIPDTVAAGVAAFPNASPTEAIMLGDWLQAQTPANLELWFGLDPAQVAAIQSLPTVAQQVAALGALVAAVA